MTSSINLKKIISVGAAALLAIGGALGAAVPAQAAPSAISNLVLLHTGQTSGQFQADLTAVTGGNFNQSSTQDKIWWIARPASAASLTSSDTTDVVDRGNPVVGEVAGNTSASTAPGGSSITGQLINVTNLVAGTAYKFYFVLRSTQSDNTTKSYSTVAMALFTTDAASPPPSSGGTPSVAPGTPTISNGVATAGAAGVWVNPSQSLYGMWLLCSSSHTARTTGNSPADCGPLSATALTNQSANWIRTSTLTITSTFNKWVSCGGANACNTTAVSSAGMYLVWYEGDGMSSSSSATVQIDGVQSSSVVSAPVLTPEQARNQIKPLPVIVQPLVAAIPLLSKPMVNAGGKLDLSAGDFSGLVSASISGKPLDLTLGAKGGLTITVPNGEAGKTADLFLKFTSGTVIIQDAIKYVAPVVVADVPTRPVSIAAGSTKLSQATADQVRQAAFANMKNTTVSCVAYAANGSAAARAAAQASAEQVCALATKSNPALTATPVIVIVDKAKAKTEAVGIKVYKN